MTNHFYRSLLHWGLYMKLWMCLRLSYYVGTRTTLHVRYLLCFICWYNLVPTAICFSWHVTSRFLQKRYMTVGARLMLIYLYKDLDIDPACTLDLLIDKYSVICVCELFLNVVNSLQVISVGKQLAAVTMTRKYLPIFVTLEALRKQVAVIISVGKYS